jgi:mRNA interferase RelE/StbE
MSFTVVWTNLAMTAYRLLRIEDRSGAAIIRDAVRALAIDPRPPQSRQLGTTDFRRLRIGSYRVLYRVDDIQCTVVVEKVGRAPGRPAE